MIGDPLSTIASGPTVKPGKSSAEKVLLKYNLLNMLPPEVKQNLGRSQHNDDVFMNINNIMVGNNSLVLKNAEKHLKKVTFFKH